MIPFTTAKIQAELAPGVLRRQGVLRAQVNADCVTTPLVKLVDTTSPNNITRRRIPRMLGAPTPTQRRPPAYTEDAVLPFRAKFSRGQAGPVELCQWRRLQRGRWQRC